MAVFTLSRMYIERFSGTKIGFLARFYVFKNILNMGLKYMQNTCNNTTLITIKHVKNYQNQLFFVPNLGVKLPKTKMCGLNMLLKLFAFDPSAVL